MPVPCAQAARFKPPLFLSHEPLLALGHGRVLGAAGLGLCAAQPGRGRGIDGAHVLLKPQPRTRVRAGLDRGGLSGRQPALVHQAFLAQALHQALAATCLPANSGQAAAGSVGLPW